MLPVELSGAGAAGVQCSRCPPSPQLYARAVLDNGCISNVWRGLVWAASAVPWPNPKQLCHTVYSCSVRLYKHGSHIFMSAPLHDRSSASRTHQMYAHAVGCVGHVHASRSTILWPLALRLSNAVVHQFRVLVKAPGAASFESESKLFIT